MFPENIWRQGNNSLFFCIRSALSKYQKINMIVITSHCELYNTQGLRQTCQTRSSSLTCLVYTVQNYGYHIFCWWGGITTATLRYCWQECKMIQLPWKSILQFLIKLTIYLACAPETSVQVFTLNKWKLTFTQKICTQMFIASLFTIMQT